MMSAPGKNLKILCVDDEPDLLDLMRSVAWPFDLELITAANVPEAQGLILQHGPRLAMVVSDFAMPGENAFDLRRAMMPDWAQIPFLIVSGHITRDHALAALELKISGFLEKPYKVSDLVELVGRAAKDRVTSILEEDELREGFVADARGMLDEMEELLLQLEHNYGDEAALNRIFACAHTIKGASGFFRPSIVTKYVHGYEDFIAPLKKGTSSLDPSKISVLLRGLDQIRGLITNLADQTDPAESLETMLRLFEAAPAPLTPAGTPGAAPAAGGPAAAVKTDEVRVDMKVLREFSEKSGEITVLRNMIDKLLTSIEDEHTDDPRVTTLASLFLEMSKAVTGIQDHIEDMKKVSLQPVIRPLQRTLRDLAGQLRKEIAFDVVGGDLRVDQRLADGLGKCLIHLLRNSADHGVEDGATRLAAGKPAAGRITLSFEESNDAVVVRIADDGAGIDVERVKRKAVERNLLSSAEAELLPADQARALIFAAGFSTAEVVSDVSGRGVGMDMVKQTVLDVGGRIEIESELGQGTTFCLRLPLPRSVHIINALMVQHDGETFAIPREDVDRILDLTSEGAENFLRPLAGRNHLLYDDEIDAIFPFDELTGRAKTRLANPKYLIRVRARTALFALAVDDVLGIEDIVVKPLALPGPRINLFRGATFVDDGRVGLVVDVDGIAEDKGLRTPVRPSTESSNAKDTTPFFTFSRGDGTLFALPQADVFRVECLTEDPRQSSGQGAVTAYHDTVMAVTDLRHNAGETSLWPMIVVRHAAGLRGYLVAELGELIELPPPADDAGVVLHEGEVVTLVNAEKLDQAPARLRLVA